jgi:DNA gyrase subunit A
VDDQQLAEIVAGAQYEIRRLQERGHHLSAALRAIDRFGEVVAAIRSAHSRDDIRDALMALLDVDEFQAMTVADMQVRMLSGQKLQQLADEHDDVQAGIAEMKSVLVSPERLVGTERGALLAAKANW